MARVLVDDNVDGPVDQRAARFIRQLMGDVDDLALPAGIFKNVRDLLEDLGGGLGVTDPVSGTAVVELPASGR